MTKPKITLDKIWAILAIAALVLNAAAWLSENKYGVDENKRDIQILANSTLPKIQTELRTDISENKNDIDKLSTIKNMHETRISVLESQYKTVLKNQEKILTKLESRYN